MNRFSFFLYTDSQFCESWKRGKGILIEIVVFKVKLLENRGNETSFSFFVNRLSKYKDLKFHQRFVNRPATQWPTISFFLETTRYALLPRIGTSFIRSKFGDDGSARWTKVNEIRMVDVRQCNNFSYPDCRARKYFKGPFVGQKLSRKFLKQFLNFSLTFNSIEFWNNFSACSFKREATKFSLHFHDAGWTTMPSLEFPVQCMHCREAGEWHPIKVFPKMKVAHSSLLLSLCPPSAECSR